MFSKSARFYDAIYSFKDYGSEAKLVRDVILSKCPRARTLIDIACGTGLHLEHWKNDFECDGLDLDPDLLAVAHERNPELSLHVESMETFDLGRSFDAVTCLFSSIGYTQSVDRLNRAIESMAWHLAPGGVLVVEPWFAPEAYEAGHLGAVFVDEPDLKIARVNIAELEGGLSRLVFHYLVGTPDGISAFTEDHRLGLFSHDEYVAAFRGQGLTVDHDAWGLMGRGLYVATKPGP
ncbi:MAG: methyltransferase domain-containing protein [Actinomycetota bacterium]